MPKSKQNLFQFNNKIYCRKKLTKYRIVNLGNQKIINFINKKNFLDFYSEKSFYNNYLD